MCKKSIFLYFVCGVNSFVPMIPFLVIFSFILKSLTNQSMRRGCIVLLNHVVSTFALWPKNERLLSKAKSKNLSLIRGSPCLFFSFAVSPHRVAIVSGDEMSTQGIQIGWP